MNRCLIVAEVGINHNGNISVAKELMNVAFSTGCDAVKFQMRTVELVYNQEELNRPRQSPWGNTNREQKKGLEFGREEYDEINRYTKNQKFIWFASPWDCPSVNFLARYNPPFIKIASALITNFELLKVIKEKNIPIILSTGMSTKEEICKAVSYLGNNLIYILACTSTYPTKTNEMNLHFISTLKEEFPKYKIGFSNHSSGIIFMIAAAALGVEMIEFHITLDRAMYGSDQASSIEPLGVQRIVKDIRAIEEAMGNGEWIVFPSEEDIRKKLRR